MIGGDYESIGHAAARYQTTVQRFGVAALSIGVKPQLTLNGVPYFTLSDVEHVADVLVNTGDAQMSFRTPPVGGDLSQDLKAIPPARLGG